jgi:hypothetical protein
MDNQLAEQLMRMDLSRLTRVVHYAVTLISGRTPDPIEPQEVAVAERITNNVNPADGDAQERLRSELDRIIERREVSELGPPDSAENEAAAARGVARIKSVLANEPMQAPRLPVGQGRRSPRNRDPA